MRHGLAGLHVAAGFARVGVRLARSRRGLLVRREGVVHRREQLVDPALVEDKEHVDEHHGTQGDKDHVQRHVGLPFREPRDKRTGHDGARAEGGVAQAKVAQHPALGLIGQVGEHRPHDGVEHRAHARRHHGHGEGVLSQSAHNREHNHEHSHNGAVQPSEIEVAHGMQTNESHRKHHGKDQIDVNAAGGAR